MKNPRYLFLGIIILAGLALAGVGINMLNQTHVEIQNIKPDLRIGAAELFSAFEQNETEANDLYLGKIIEIQGNISAIEIPSAGRANIVLESSLDSFGGISCSFSEINAKQLKALKKGSPIRIRGECAGFLMDVNLVRCVIIPS